MNRVLITLSMMCLLQYLHSQSSEKKEINWMDFINQISENYDNKQNINNLVSDLSYLEDHPLNVNIITKEELEHFPFLSEKQIENLLFYLYTYGPMQSLYELKMVAEFDQNTILFIKPFLYIGNKPVNKSKITVNNLLANCQQDILTRISRTLNEKSGSVDNSETTEPDPTHSSYLGNPWYGSIRYLFNSADKLQFGFTAEKDAGEPMFGKGKNGFDYFSFWFSFNKLLGLKSFAIGNYRLSFGQGLVINTDFSPGKTSYTTNVVKNARGITRHTSASESDYFTGVAATVNYKAFDITGFYSLRSYDAVIVNNCITSIKQSGLHQTIEDEMKRDRAELTLYGMNIVINKQRFRIGLTVASYFYNYSYQPAVTIYNRYEFRGKENINIGIDYRYRYRSFSLFGETATGSNGTIATINGVQCDLYKHLSLTFVYRNYPAAYQAFFSRSFGDGSKPVNEQGFYLGAALKPFKKITISAYIDLIRFPWLKTGVDKPSESIDCLLQTNYLLSENITMYARYKYRDKEKNLPANSINGTITTLYQNHRLRYSISYSFNKQVFFNSSFDWNYYQTRFADSGSGVLLSQSAGWKIKGLPIQTDMNFSIFDTDNFGSTVYSNEKNILYSFSMPSLNGKGLRYGITFRYDILKKLSLWLKLAQTHYFDKEIIGTGKEQINGSNKADLYVQLRYKF